MLVVLLCVTLVGWKTYNYFFDTTKPFLRMQGLNQDAYYAGDTACMIACNKSGEISIWLDEQPLITSYRMPGNETGHEFTIPTKTMNNGKHMLRAQLIDDTFQKNQVELAREFYVDNVPLQAAFVKPDAEYKVFQGRTLHVQFQLNKNIQEATIDALSHNFDCLPESKNSSVYEAYIPIPCEENPNEYLFSVHITDKVGNKLHLDNKFQVVMYPFKKSVLHVSDQKLEEEKTLGRDDKEFRDIVQKLTQASPKEKLWKGAFCTPIEIQRVTTEFGTVRTTQQKGRYAHKALDIINAPKSVVWATQDGIVVLKDRFASSGNTVIIDHGMGVLSMFFHLDGYADIQEGDVIAKGNPLGTLGKTGYAKGYHLHWEMRVNNVAIDPMQWTKAIF